MSSKGRSADGYVPDPTGFFQTQPKVTRAILPYIGMNARGRYLEPSCGKGAIGKVMRQQYPHIHLVGVEIDKKRAKQAEKAKVEITGDGGKKLHVKVFDRVICSDFYEVKLDDFEPTRDDIVTGYPFDQVITNPSFSIWLPFAEHCFKFADRTTLLLPVNVKASKKRAEWWRAHPAHERILSKRPSFAISVKCVYANGKRADRASVKLCSFQELIALDDKPKTECPICGAGIEKTTSDSSEYGWYSFGPDITRGLWDVIDTPEDE